MIELNGAPYKRPFRSYDHPHESDDPLCLSRLHYEDPARATWLECHEAAVLLCGSYADQFAFWGARHLTELGLKLLADQKSELTHDLGRLLRVLPKDFFSALEDKGIVPFIEDLQAIDPNGDACRYGFDAGGRPALGSVCCVDRSELRSYVEVFFDLVESLLPRCDQA